MTSAISQAAKFLENIAAASTTRGGKTGTTLTPVGEHPPRMWAIDAVWQPFTGTSVNTLSGNVRKSSLCVSNENKQTYVRNALTTLLVLIAAKTKEHSSGNPVKSKVTGQWCNLIVTWARIIFTQPLETIGKGATEVQLTAALAGPLVNWYDEMHETDIGGPTCQTLTQLCALGLEQSNALDFPVLEEFTLAELKAAIHRDHSKENPAYYALVVYMSGRALTDYTTTAVQVTRPKNLQTKFNEGATWGSIGGIVKMSKGGFTYIAKAWQMNTTMRMGLLIPLISLDAGEAYITGNIIYTMFKLLRGAGMAHVGIIAAFLRKFPYAAEMVELRSELYQLALDSEALQRIRPELQPYYKLLYADAAGIFDSKSLVHLTGLAVSVLADATNHLNQYKSTPNNQWKQAFDELRAYHETLE